MTMSLIDLLHILITYAPYLNKALGFLPNSSFICIYKISNYRLILYLALKNIFAINLDSIIQIYKKLLLFIILISPSLTDLFLVCFSAFFTITLKVKLSHIIIYAIW